MVERTWTSTPASSISASLVSVWMQFGCTVRKKQSPIYMSVSSEFTIFGLSCNHGRGESAAENEERSGRVCGMMWVCMSIRNRDAPDILLEPRLDFP